MTAAARAWIVGLATLVAVAATARLGWWQLDRAAQKEALQAQLEARRDLPPVGLEELAKTSDQALSQHFRRTVLSGRWLPQYSVFLDNRQMGGRQGFYLVTPLELSPGDAVLVQRGWAPRSLLDRTALPAIVTPAGPVTVAGRVAPPPGRLYALGTGDTGTLRQNIEVAGFERETGLHLRPLSVLQDDPTVSTSAIESNPSSDGLKRDWPGPAVDVQKHYGYAFQWFAMSSLLTGLYVWFQLLQPWLRHRGRPR